MFCFKCMNNLSGQYGNIIFGVVFFQLCLIKMTSSDLLVASNPMIHQVLQTRWTNILICLKCVEALIRFGNGKTLPN